MDWLGQHRLLVTSLFPAVVVILSLSAQAAAQQNLPAPPPTFGSGRIGTPGSAPPMTPGVGTSGTEAGPGTGSRPVSPFRAFEAPALAPEALHPPPGMSAPGERLPPGTPTPGERKPERPPGLPPEGLERQPEPTAPAARSPIEQIFTGLPEQPISRELSQFGYDLFTQPGSTFAPVSDVPVGPDYILGPGDTLQVYLWGMVDDAITLQVNRRGEIFMPRVGTIPVWGMQLGEVRRLIHEHLSRQFSGFRLSVHLSELRSIQVFIVGEVARPGVYTVSSLATVLNALFASGGPTKLGSLRTIKLIRNNRTIGTLDMYDFLLRGDRAHDIRLESGDTVFVSPIGPVVGVAGNVKRPAIYEMVGRLRISDLFQMAGGVTLVGYLQRVQIERVKPHVEKLVLDIQLSDLQGRTRSDRNIFVEDGDLVKIFPIDTRIYNVVSLEGSVRRPGEYELKSGMRISDLVPPAEVLPYAYVSRIEVIRTKPDFTREIHALDLQRVWQGDRSQDLYLEPRDQVLIPSESRILGSVTLSGEVRRPGTYPIVQGERLSSVLIRAGGFTEDAYPKGAVFIREQLRQQQQVELERFIRSQEEILLLESARSTAGAAELVTGSREEVALVQQSVQQRRQLLEILKAKIVLGRLVVRVDTPQRLEGTADDIPLEGGDSLSIPKQPSSVLVFGSVRNPTAVVYEPSRDVEYYLNRAGGLNKEADKAELYIVKADGSAVAGFLKLRKIDSGDIIVVPTKVDPKVRTLPIIKDVATILGQFALTIGVLAALL